MKSRNIILISTGVFLAGLTAFILIRKKMNSKAFDYLPESSTSQNSTISGETSSEKVRSVLINTKNKESLDNGLVTLYKAEIIDKLEFDNLVRYSLYKYGGTLFKAASQTSYDYIVNKYGVA